MARSFSGRSKHGGVPKHGRSRLTAALFFFRLQAVEALLAAGACPHAVDAEGATPLLCAVRSNCNAAAAALLAVMAAAGGDE